MMNNVKKQVKGITLIALVVTLVVLLILAGITIGLISGNDGILSRAIRAKNEYERATRNEQEYLENLYSSIKVADNDDAEITINMKDLKSIIDETVKQKVEEEVAQKMSVGTQGINANSVLMSSTNDDLSEGEKKLNSFENTFTAEEFDKYFEYNGTTGELTCKQDGWFSIYMRMHLGDVSTSWAWNEGICLVNEVEVSRIEIDAGNGANTQEDSSTTSVYLKKGDKLAIKKITRQAATKVSKLSVVILKI